MSLKSVVTVGELLQHEEEQETWSFGSLYSSLGMVERVGEMRAGGRVATLGVVMSHYIISLEMYFLEKGPSSQ